MKVDRLLSILMMLVNKKKITAKELADYFEVSVRTIQRDMDTLNMAGVPIYADVGKNGGYQLLDNYKLNKSFLNVNEAKVLIAFLESLEQTVPYSEVKSIFNKFSTVLPDEIDDHKIVIKLNPLINEKNFKEHINILSNARDHFQKVHIKYMDINFRETSRIICPYSLVMMGSAWYIYGYCALREDFRIFKLSRIVSCEMLSEKFEVKELPETLPWDNNLDSRRESTKIILEVDKVLQGKLPDYFDYEDCKIEEDKIMVTLNFPVDEWLYSLLFGLVPYVKILEPAWLREEFVRRLQISIEKNIL
ncbi:helix-turn-helix transcriptional regulator [Vallitalea okinawensis]|uniref:helix-turn-helix transcriptional regulator n=1 Tax=Vallitalea okinawensis TaxID=2078660 RepID=UPI000CFBCCF0|nr:YafY family protein [Vallitalea okinawensis]